jgi:hypothetical protein
MTEGWNQPICLPVLYGATLGAESVGCSCPLYDHFELKSSYNEWTLHISQAQMHRWPASSAIIQ